MHCNGVRLVNKIPNLFKIISWKRHSTHCAMMGKAADSLLGSKYYQRNHGKDHLIVASHWLLNASPNEVLLGLKKKYHFFIRRKNEWTDTGFPTPFSFKHDHQHESLTKWTSILANISVGSFEINYRDRAEFNHDRKYLQFSWSVSHLWPNNQWKN